MNILIHPTKEALSFILLLICCLVFTNASYAENYFIRLTYSNASIGDPRPVTNENFINSIRGGQTEDGCISQLSKNSNMYRALALQAGVTDVRALCIRSWVMPNCKQSLAETCMGTADVGSPLHITFFKNGDQRQNISELGEAEYFGRSIMQATTFGSMNGSIEPIIVTHQEFSAQSFNSLTGLKVSSCSQAIADEQMRNGLASLLDGKKFVKMEISCFDIDGNGNIFHKGTSKIQM